MTKPNADKVAVDSSVFVGNLTASENDVQKALEKVDGLTLGTPAVWGGITGTLSSQTDLQAALDAKFTLPSLTAGSVLFSDGATITEDNTGFSYDDSMNSLVLASSLGSNLVTNGDFSSASGWTAPTGWAITGGVATHNANGTGALTRTVSVTAGSIYELKFTISGYTTGTVTVTIGGYSSGSLSANGQYSVRFFATNTGTILVTPSNTARFSIDDITLKLFSGSLSSSGRRGSVLTAGGADFGANVQIYGADTNVIPSSATGALNIYGSTYGHIKLYTSGSLRAGIVASSSGLGIHAPTVNFYSSAAGSSMMGYMASAGFYSYGYSGAQTFGAFGTSVVAGTTSLNLNYATLQSFGSFASRVKYVDTNNYTLTGSEHVILADVSTAAGCNGTPTACSSYVSEGTCNAHSGVGCSWSGGDCSGFTSQSVCEANPGCTWSGYADCSVFGSEFDCTSYSGCSWYDSCSVYNGSYSACVGTSGCSWNSSMSECYGNGACTGSYYVGYSCSGTYGSCTGTALCSSLSTEGACNAESGCSWSENMTLNLPQGSGIAYGTVGSSMSRHYQIKKVAGAGGVVVTPYSGDDIDGSSTYTVAALYDSVHLYYAGIAGNCSDFTGSGQGACEATSGCTWNDTCSVWSNQIDCTNNGCSWSSSQNQCTGGTTSCTGTYTKHKRWHAVSDKASPTIFTQTASKTVANTVTETTLTNTGSGNLTMPPNLLQAGKSIRIRLWAYHSSVSGATIRFKIKIGSTTVLDTGAHNSHNDTNKLIRLDAIITCRTAGASGTVFGQASFEEFGNTPDSNGVVNTTTSTIDTTTAKAIDITAQWGTASASNTITCTNLIVEVI